MKMAMIKRWEGGRGIIGQKMPSFNFESIIFFWLASYDFEHHLGLDAKYLQHATLGDIWSCCELQRKYVCFWGSFIFQKVSFWKH